MTVFFILPVMFNYSLQCCRLLISIYI